jgi:hypothetical protein
VSRFWFRLIVLAAALAAAAGCSPAGAGTSASQPGRGTATRTAPGTVSPAASSPSSSAAPADVPRPAHTLVVILENRSYGQVIGNPAAPFINSLARRGALFTNSHAVVHPSEPNYLALFSGSTQGVSDDSCPHSFRAPNLAAGLLAAHDSFAGYSESLPRTGSEVCTAGEYARKHVPWTDFTNVPGSVSKPFTDFPAGDFARLPTVSFVIPNLCDDMHDCPVATGDAWLKTHIGPYAGWAMTHDSLLIVTWDENDGSPGNQIPTIFAGQQVKPGRYGELITHYSVLRAIEDAYGLPYDGHATVAPPIPDIWK